MRLTLGRLDDNIRGMRCLAVLAPLAIVVAPALAHAADLDVGPGQPYATIQEAIDAAVAGDAVLVHAGEYTEALSLSQSGTAAAPIAVRAAGDGQVVVNGSVELDGDWWQLEDLTFVVPAGIRGIDVGGSHNRMLRLDLSGGTNNGIDGSGEDNHVLDSKIHGFDAGMSDAHCIVLNTNATDWVIAGNELVDCSGDSIQLYGPSGQALRTIKNTRIERNVMRYTGAITRMENAVDVKDADGLIIADNEMSGFVQNKTLVFQKGPANIEVRCNVMFDGFTGVEFRGEDGGTVEAVSFSLNLLHDFTEYALKFDGVSSADVLSNTFVDAASDGLRIEGAGLAAGQVRNNLWVRTGSLDAGSFDADHNGFFETGSIGFSSASDVQQDPLLDATYALGAGSPMIDAGVDVGLPFSGSAPDIGAFEDGLRQCSRVGTGGAGGAGPGSGGGTTTAGSGGGVTGAGGAATGASGGSERPEEEGGCSCTTPGTHSRAPVAASVLAVAWLVRRRRRAPSG
jgi:MYXO-CTERM domain-containing protein